MLKGHVFDEQLFSSECFALFIDTFLAKNCGVVKGCNLSNSTNSVTISDGFFCIRGRFLEIQGEDTLATGNDNAYCKLVCEIDLSKENTESELTQAVLKIVNSTNTYPQLTQQDLTEDGTIYQFEFAQFKTGTNGVTEFKDTRKFLDFDSIYTKVNKETQEVIEQIKKELASVKDGSKYIIKDNIAVIQGQISPPEQGSGVLTTSIKFNYPEGFNRGNCVPISITAGKTYQLDALWWTPEANDAVGFTKGNGGLAVGLGKEEITLSLSRPDNQATSSNSFFRLVLMKLPEVDISGYELGDINMDGEVTEEDKEILKNFMTGKTVFDSKQYKLADMNSDGEVDTIDLQLIQKKIIGG